MAEGICIAKETWFIPQFFEKRQSSGTLAQWHPSEF
jgi:hypothetical protein